MVRMRRIMVEVSRLLYIVVVDEERRDGDEKGGTASFHYTRSVLQSCLQLMGCKARHAFKMSRRVFQVMQSENSPAFSPQSSTDFPSKSETKSSNISDSGCPIQRENPVNTKHLERSKSVQFEMYKKLTTVVVPRETFLDVVCDTLSRYKYMGPNQRADLALACRSKEQKESITILLCGTSGCGKSTLSSLLGSRLGITTVISTDSIRHMMRSYTDEKQNPLLWASTYHAGEFLDPVAVAEARAKRKAKKLAGVSKLDEASSGVSNENQSGGATPAPQLISKKQIAIEGYKAQSEMVSDGIDRLITTWEERKESGIVEGVHLSLNFVMDLMKKHPSIIPFMIYISDEEKHTERFAVRAKYMALDPAKNKYVKYIRNIRTIQDYLCSRADKYLIPKVNNTNVDKSVAAIHATVFSCLRRREAKETLYDPVTKSVPIIYEEYRNQCFANSLSSKGMFQLIQRKGSSRHLMALVNTDGSVAKAWPVNSVDSNGKPNLGNGGENCVGSPMSGPLHISKAEPVNLQFGSFGISAFPSDTRSTSHNGSVDELRFDGTHSCSRCHSSSCSSPRLLEQPAKELKEEFSVSDSDEEIDDHQFVDTDDEISNVRSKDVLQESDGSIDEESSESDEEYEDLAMRDGLVNGYWSDHDEPYKANKILKTPNKEEDPEEILPLGPFSSISLMEYVTANNMYDFRVTQI